MLNIVATASRDAEGGLFLERDTFYIQPLIVKFDPR